MALSYSQLQSYRRCPRQYEYAYKKKIPRKGLSAGESFGVSMHSALKKWGELELARSGQRVATSGQLPLFMGEETSAPEEHAALTADHLLDLWHSSFIVEGYETRVEADMARQRGEEMLRFFFDWWQSTPHEVVAVEKGFSLHIDDVSVAGRFDRIEKGETGLKIIDFKTSQPRGQDAADADLQLSVYALACQECLGQPCESLTLLHVNEEGITEITTNRTENQIRDARSQIRSIKERIDSGDFHPTPSREVCRYCPYSQVCDVAAV